MSDIIRIFLICMCIFLSYCLGISYGRRQAIEEIRKHMKYESKKLKEEIDKVFEEARKRVAKDTDAITEETECKPGEVKSSEPSAPSIDQ